MHRRPVRRCEGTAKALGHGRRLDQGFWVAEARCLVFRLLETMDRKNHTDAVETHASFRTIRALRRSQAVKLATLGSFRTVGLWTWAGLCRIGFVSHNRALVTAGRPGWGHGCAKRSQFALDQVAGGPTTGLQPVRIPPNEPNSPGTIPRHSAMLSFAYSSRELIVRNEANSRSCDQDASSCARHRRLAAPRAIASEFRANVSRAPRPRIAGKMPATREARVSHAIALGLHPLLLLPGGGRSDRDHD